MQWSETEFELEEKLKLEQNNVAYLAIKGFNYTNWFFLIMELGYLNLITIFKRYIFFIMNL